MSFALKLSGAVALLLSGLFCGIFLSDRLRRRRDLIRAFIELLSGLKTSIRYNSGELISLIKASAPNYIREFFMTDSVDFDFYWRNSVLKIPKAYALKSGDYELLYGFGKNLGATDIAGQIEHIELYTEFFKRALKNAEDEYRTKGRLYKTLGFFAGASLSIMLI